MNHLISALMPMHAAVSRRLENSVSPGAGLPPVWRAPVETVESRESRDEGRPETGGTPVLRCSWKRLFARVKEFQEKKFPEQSVAAKLRHLSREVREVIAKPDDIVEFADCLNLILGSAAAAGFTAEQLCDAAHSKVDVCWLRKWGPADSEGVHHHLSEPVSREEREGDEGYGR